MYILAIYETTFRNTMVYRQTGIVKVKLSTTGEWIVQKASFLVKKSLEARFPYGNLICWSDSIYSDQ